MVMAVFLYVDKPVASLQFDLDTTGNVILESTVQKQIVSNRLPNGKLRVIVYGLNTVSFSGKFSDVDAPVFGVSNVVGAKLDGSDALCKVTTLSRPTNVNVTKVTSGSVTAVKK